MPANRIKNAIANKDTAGAGGALLGSGFFVVWQTDIHTLWNALFTAWGLAGDALNSASNISTDLTIIIGSALASYIASKFTKN